MIGEEEGLRERKFQRILASRVSDEQPRGV